MDYKRSQKNNSKRVKHQLDKDNIMYYLAKYNTQVEIANKFGITKQAVNEWVKKYGIRIKKSHFFKVRKINDTFYLFEKQGKKFVFLGKFSENQIEKL